MRRGLRACLILAAVVAAGVGGYWSGRQSEGALVTVLATAEAEAAGPVLYYRDPDGRPLYSLTPKDTPDGRAYRPVHAGEDASVEPGAKSAARATPNPSEARRIRYYRNPMGLPDVSPVPKKDSMGMEYIPVYESDDDDSGTLTLSPAKIQRIGVTSAPASMRIISEPVRAPGVIQLDERQIAVIAMRAESFIEKVENVTTGSEVRKGQPLLRVYSPAIALAGADYIAALSMRFEPAAVRGARQKLMNLAVPDSVMSDMERTRQMPPVLTWVAPRDGLVLERNVVDGMRAMPGAVLFRFADIGVVWAIVEVSERDLGAVAEGQPVAVRVRSYPDRVFAGKVALIYPQLNPATRTARVRIELANPGFLLRPDMYADAIIDTGRGQAVLSVPEGALIDSGDRRVVIVDKGEGRYEPRPVKIGRRGAGYVEIRAGVSEHENVVTAANFLIDAESNLKGTSNNDDIFARSIAGSSRR